MKNRLFVTCKPKNIICNHFLSKIKRKYNIKKAGFSGTLDPFASGVLIVAFGQYTKLFRFLKKTPKKYRATLWLGAKSDTLDIDGVKNVQNMLPFAKDSIDIIFKNLTTTISFIPPKYSAKKINGKRAYELAREDKQFCLKEQTMEVYELNLIHYMHPFITFEASVSEGGYIRSLGELIAQKFGFCGSLSMLQRVCEGEFFYENEKALNPLKYLNIPQNWYLKDSFDVKLGKKLLVDDFLIKDEGAYYVSFEDEFAIIKITQNKVIYELNKVKIC